MSIRGLALVIVAALSVAACASSKGGDNPDGGGSDGAPNDGVVDPCDGVECPGLTFCKEGTCVPYPACPVDGGVSGPDPVPMCTPGTECRNGVCIPIGVDVDMDGFPAGTDCDEQNPEIHPGVPEVCNGVDDDCTMTVDDGDPAVLCSGAQAGNVCVSGSCVCPNGNFDLDPSVPGCECAATPALDQGMSCATAIDVGNLVDNAQAVTVSGNVPNGRGVWYRLRGVDSADTSCDNLHVRARLTTNPGDEFRIRAFRGNCSTAITPPGQFTDIDWYVDFRATVGGQLTGQCPCWSGTPVDNVSPCSDDGADYYVVVERATGGTDTCAAYNVELSNGLYDAP